MSRRPALLSTCALLAISAAAATGCGGGDSANAEATAPKTAATPAATTTPAKTNPGKTAGGHAIGVVAKEFSFTPASAAAFKGKVKITMTNAGSAEHELVLLKTDQPADSLKVTGGRVSEKDSVGEISETAAGKIASHSFNLKPGRYVYVCNIPGHYQGGMYGTLLVQ